MATYKDDLDILKAAEKADTNKLTFNAITELDNKGLLGRYGNEDGPGPSPQPVTTSDITVGNAMSSNFTAQFFIVRDGVLFADHVTVQHDSANTIHGAVNGTTIWFSIVDEFEVDIVGDLESIPGPVAGDTHPAVLVNGNGTVTVIPNAQLA